MPTRFLMLALLLLGVLCGAYLFARNAAGLDPLAGKDWWTLAFAESRDEASLDIALTNYSQDEDFHYAVFEGSRLVAESDFQVAPGTRKVILLPVERSKTGRVTVEVRHGNETQQIYRQR